MTNLPRLLSLSLLSALAIVGSTGCGILSPTMRTVAELPDGSKRVEVVDLGLEAQVPGDAVVTSTSSSAAILQWAYKYKALRIERKSQGKLENADALAKEVEANKSTLDTKAPETFDKGFDVVYAYRAEGKHHVGYTSQVTVEGVTYGCYLSSTGTEADVAPAKTACRSLAKAAAR